MKKFTKSFTTGAVALVFGVLGYQSALLVHYASVTRIAQLRDTPDTVYVQVPGPEMPGSGVSGPAVPGSGFSSQVMSGSGMPDGNNSDAVRCGGDAANFVTSGRGELSKSAGVLRKRSNHSGIVSRIRESVPPRRQELFVFNPNTASLEDFVRLGFTPKQAGSIDNYRRKGGRFRRKTDFAKSYVVSDEMYRKLEKYIDIPGIDLNTADSATFDSLPGIGGYFARRMVEHRRRLHGYSCTAQLLDIRGFDSTRLAALEGLISVSSPAVYPLWELPEDSLRIHPYIGKSAHGIVLFRNNNPKTRWSLSALREAGVLDEWQTEKLSLCNVRQPGQE